MRVALVMLTLVLAACVPQATGNTVMDTVLFGTRGPARQFPTGDGRMGWELHCDGAAHSMSECFTQAQAHCPAGFDTISQRETPDGGDIDRSLMVACR